MILYIIVSGAIIAFLPFWAYRMGVRAGLHASHNLRVATSMLLHHWDRERAVHPEEMAGLRYELEDLSLIVMEVLK